MAIRHYAARHVRGLKHFNMDHFWLLEDVLTGDGSADALIIARQIRDIEVARPKRIIFIATEYE
jgi:hypothetical protein